MNTGGMKKKHKADGLMGKKKLRVEKAVVPFDSPLSTDLFRDESIKRLRIMHDSNGPYKHVVFHDLCSRDRMRLIHDEAKNNMTATFKETDLFKVRFGGSCFGTTATYPDNKLITRT